MNVNYKIFISAQEAMMEELALKVSSFDTYAPFLLPLKFRVCGFEKISLVNDLDNFEFYTRQNFGKDY